MKINLDIKGLKQSQALLAGFSDRRLRAAAATALTRTAREVEGEWIGEIFSRIDRPTSFTVNSVVVKTATAETLRAEVFIRDRPARPDAPAPVEWLAPQEVGGQRYVKKFERALMAQGSMPAGHKVVPGKYAQLDGFGNISRAQITQVLTQLGTQFSPGYARTISTKMEKRLASAKRHGRDYVAIVRALGKLQPGVYQRNGRELLPVFLYVTTVTYHKRTDLIGIARQQGPTLLGSQMQRALDEHIAKLQALARQGA